MEVYIFLSRPRRFGKSLLLSKFQYLFGGQKDLFKGLYIYEKTDYDFEEYPVLHFSFASFGHKLENFEEVLHRTVLNYAEQFNFTINKTTLSEDFTTLVKTISERGKPIVLLIDEYDTPITDFLTEIKKAKKNQSVLKDFFAPLKNLDAQGHLRFLFITGVSKFSKVSLFSDLNNLKDITISRFSDDLVGITHEELLTNFSEHIEAMAQYLQYPKEELLSDIKYWYNGYAYNPDIPLYNPFSLLNFFSERRFSNFWFATGTPTFLVKTIRDKGIKPTEFVNKEVSETFFTKFSLAELDMTSLLFQTGYLTIKAIQRKRTKLRYFLDYPNEEVRQAMMHNLVEAFTYKNHQL